MRVLGGLADERLRGNFGDENQSHFLYCALMGLSLLEDERTLCKLDSHSQSQNNERLLFPTSEYAELRIVGPKEIIILKWS